MQEEIITFEKVLKNIVESSGMKKAHFAKKLGLSNKTFYNYYEGITSPSFDEGVRIIQAIGGFSVHVTRIKSAAHAKK